MSLRLLFKSITLLAVLAALCAGGYLLWQKFAGSGTELKYRTLEARTGSVTQSVSANGTLKPVVLVNVGTQVSGTVQKLHVDFNDRVKAGQVLLELDPAVLAAQVTQTEANLANVRATLDLTTANEARAQKLFQQEYISRQELDQAVQAARSARAQIEQINAQLSRDRTNLGYTVIRSPVSGVVVARAVDLGQTVAASFQTPTLFQIAQDLRKMQIDSAFAEADIGNIKVGQPVQFTVDAYPNRTFNASVRQIRLNATTQQNVVTYNVVVAVDNPEEILLPSMTAYVNILIAQRSDVLLIPNSALRFRPDAGAAPPSAKSGRAAKNAAAPPAGTGESPAPEEGDGSAAPPRRAAGGSAQEGADGAPGKFAGRRRAESKNGESAAKGRGAARGAAEELRGVVYVLENNQLRRVPLRVGISDGRFTEVIGGELKAGDAIVTGVVDTTAPVGPAQGTFRMRLF